MRKMSRLCDNLLERLGVRDSMEFVKEGGINSVVNIKVTHQNKVVKKGQTSLS